MISYTDDFAGVQSEQLEGFFDGWPDPPSREAHLRLQPFYELLGLEALGGMAIRNYSAQAGRPSA